MKSRFNNKKQDPERWTGRSSGERRPSGDGPRQLELTAAAEVYRRDLSNLAGLIGGSSFYQLVSAEAKDCLVAWREREDELSYYKSEVKRQAQEIERLGKRAGKAERELRHEVQARKTEGLVHPDLVRSLEDEMDGLAAENKALRQEMMGMRESATHQDGPDGVKMLWEQVRVLRQGLDDAWVVIGDLEREVGGD